GGLNDSVFRSERMANELASLRDEIQVVTSELERTNAEAREFETAMKEVIAVRNRELIETAEELEAATSEIATRNRELTEAGAVIGEARSELAERNRELTHTAVQLNAARSQWETATTSLDQIYRSRSWRLTAPLRNVVGWLRNTKSR